MRDDPANDIHQHPTSTGTPPPGQRLSLRGIKVFAVDDEPDALQLVRRLLEGAGAEVFTAVGAQEALDALDRQTVDVILSDIGMAGLDGYEFIRRVRAGESQPNRNVPAIALTAFARSEDRTRALIAGYQAHMAKPVEPAELLAAVASLVNRTGR